MRIWSRPGPILLFLGILVVSLPGITVTILHPDQMALLPLFKEGFAAFNPGWFEKPPFHTYTNYLLAVLPASLISSALDLSPGVAEGLRVTFSRMVSTLLFLGAVAMFHTILRRNFGNTTALLLATLLGTSAGFIVHAHFLTADVPLTAWMLAAFYACQRILLQGDVRAYVLAGLLTGIATATKYNGLAVGIAIPVAHYLREFYVERRSWNWASFLFPPRLVLGLICVGVGFVAANPFSVLDHGTFVYDFVHNYKVASVYEGQTGSSYGHFFLAMIETLGLPCFVLAAFGSAMSLVLWARGLLDRKQGALLLMAAAVFWLYYAKFAPFPRLETRFVMPVVPFALFLSSAALEYCLSRTRRAVVVKGAVAVVAGYGLVCAYVVKSLFAADPRLAAAEWLSGRVVQGSTVESDIYSPAWPVAAYTSIVERPMPFVTGRERLFRELFPGDPWVVGTAEYYREVDSMIGWYDGTALARRHPDFLVINSLYYGRFTQPGPRRDLYPEMQAFFSGLLEERFGYRIAFDRASGRSPWWVYPRNADFQENRITILIPEAH